MKTFIADIIPKLQKFSQKLDNLTLLTNQHWVVVDEIANSKTVYIFRSNNELLISKNGEVEKAKWEYLGNNSLLLDLKKDKSYLFRHGFFDENVLALKIDGKEEYALMVNETRYDKELNSSARVLEFLNRNYFEPNVQKKVTPPPDIVPEPKEKLTDQHKPAKEPEEVKASSKKNLVPQPVILPEPVEKVFDRYKTNKGIIEVEHPINRYPPSVGDKVFINGKPAPDGKYKLAFFWYAHIKNGVIFDTSSF